MGSPGGDGVSVLLVDTVHSGHRDLLDVFFLYAHVGALNGHCDAAVQRAEARDDLQGGGEDKRLVEDVTACLLINPGETGRVMSGGVFRTHVGDFRVGAGRRQR